MQAVSAHWGLLDLFCAKILLQFLTPYMSYKVIYEAFVPFFGVYYKSL